MNYYRTLGIDADCDFAAVKKAYYRRAKECHPDLFGNSPEKEEEFKRVVEAFDTLSDPEKRRAHDIAAGIEIGAAPGEKAVAAPSGRSVMDTEADDTLEELVVGNRPPDGTTLATLFSDMERTKVFIMFREGRDLLARGRVREAARTFEMAVSHSPGNILYRYYWGRSLLLSGMPGKARAQFKAAIRLGARRTPPQSLDRIHAELERLERNHLPLWHFLKMALLGRRPKSSRPPDEEMIEETNRAMARLMAEREREEKEAKKLNR